MARDHVAEGVFTAGIEGRARSPDGALHVVNFGRDGSIGRVDAQGNAELFIELPDGSIGNGLRFDDHDPEGMRCDAARNLYIAPYDAGVVAVVSPEGALLREVPLTGRKPGNVAFGGTDGRLGFATLQDRGAVETFQTSQPGREYGQRPDPRP